MLVDISVLLDDRRSDGFDKAEWLRGDWPDAETRPFHVGELGPADEAQEFFFDNFRAIPARRLLLGPDDPIHIGGRAFDLLVALLEKAGELVSKSELLARVWPQAFVGEGNLKVHIAALRRALGDGQAGKRLISAVNGRGYCFVAPVRRCATVRARATPVAKTAGARLPRPLARLVGLEGAIRRIVELVDDHRLITIVGAGGVGKSSVALAAAAELEDEFEDGICLVDLAVVRDKAKIAPTLEASVRQQVAEATSNDLQTLIGGRSILLVLDNCEHLADALAPLIDGLLRFAPRAHVISTSREPLGVAGEHLHQVHPLGLPPSRVAITDDEALRYPAVELFVERASDALGEFELRNQDLSAVVDICHKLDGLPLAIELAVTHLEIFGLRGLGLALDDPLRLPKSPSRLAAPRHQSLRAMLDWSYCLLTPWEQDLLLRLSGIAGSFSLDDALVIAAAEHDCDADPLDLIASLVAKSLVLSQSDGLGRSLRILETTRAFAAEKQRVNAEANLA
jgi:predicted ATPase/DNA-binding winged helix-turn-helix (wHTH) protein